jgi:hypothetical protein
VAVIGPRWSGHAIPVAVTTAVGPPRRAAVAVVVAVVAIAAVVVVAVAIAEVGAEAGAGALGGGRRQLA